MILFLGGLVLLVVGYFAYGRLVERPTPCVRRGIVQLKGETHHAFAAKYGNDLRKIAEAGQRARRAWTSSFRFI